MSDFSVPPPTGGNYANVVLSGPVEPGGRHLPPQILADQLTLFQPGGGGYKPH